MSQREFEKKLLIEEDEYITILLWLSKFIKKTITQINYYYDTDDLNMNKNGITCRIREIENEFRAEIKKHHYGVSECSCEEAGIAANKNDISFFDGLGVSYKGELTTQRTVICDEGKFKIVIDKNTYLGINDYEIEIEYTPEEMVRAHKCLQDIAGILENVYKNFDVIEFYSRTKNFKSKSERFFERYVTRTEKIKNQAT